MNTAQPRESAWFENWFREDYLQLYQHRDEEQSKLQVSSLLGYIELSEKPIVLDMACGAGRHLKFLQQLPGLTIGADLSPYLLEQAGKNGCINRIQMDMRSLGFSPQKFDLVTLFFTSFGYMESTEKDFEVFLELAGLVKLGGYLFLDLMNPQPILKTLPNEDEQWILGEKVVQKRFFQDGMVQKKILWHRDDKIDVFEEKVRLYSLQTLEEWGEECSLKLQQVFGSETFQEYDDLSSPRMSILFVKEDPVS